MPMVQASSAVSVVLLPVFVKLLKVQGKRVFNRSVSIACMLFAAVSLCYLAFLLLFGEKVFLWFYDDRYVEHSNLLLVAGLIPVSAGLQHVLGSALRSIARPDLIFWSKSGGDASKHNDRSLVACIQSCGRSH
jgi:O-antigen/teichoic acid export membrane protein